MTLLITLNLMKWSACCWPTCGKESGNEKASHPGKKATDLSLMLQAAHIQIVTSLNTNQPDTAGYQGYGQRLDDTYPGEHDININYADTRGQGPSVALPLPAVRLPSLLLSSAAKRRHPATTCRLQAKLARAVHGDGVDFPSLGQGTPRSRKLRLA